MKTFRQPSVRVRLLISASLFITAACTTAGDRDPAKSGSGTTITPEAPSRAAASDEQAAVRMFVQEFYAWYAPIANASHRAPAWYTVLDQRPRVLSDTLLRALRKDREEQEKVAGEIVGLDFDPFLASQDPCTRYVARNVEESGPTYRVSVFGACGSIPHSQPDVVAEVARRDSSWVFVDFHYPSADDGHLLGILISPDTSSTKR